MWQRAKFLHGYPAGRKVWVHGPPIDEAHTIIQDKLNGNLVLCKGGDRIVSNLVGDGQLLAVNRLAIELLSGPTDFAEDVPLVKLEDWLSNGEEMHTDEEWARIRNEKNARARRYDA